MTMRLPRGVLAVAAALTAACTTTVVAPPPADPPRIVSFTATPDSIRAGESTQLAFEVSGADSVELLDQRGQPVTLDGDGATVTPAATTLYVLRVSGKGGRDSAYVRVRVDDVDSLFLAAVPTEIDSGGEVSLVWSALGGLTAATLTDGAGNTVPISGASGLVTVKPARSTTYTLRAEQGGGEPPLTLETSVTVRPVIHELAATPPAALSTETISLSWRTAGADRVRLREATFGEVLDTTTNVDDGVFVFTVPPVLPGDAGTMLPSGFPLSFTLEASTNAPAQSVSRTLPSTVGRGPQIHAFDVPSHATEQTLVSMAWRASAVRLELYADGQLVYGVSGLTAESGSTVFPAPTTDVVFTLVARDANGLEVRTERTLQVVKRPDVMTFTAPALVFSGNPASVSWQTRDAATVTVRLKNGPVIYATSDPAQLAAGAAMVRVSRPTELVLEAINAAGAKDVEVKTIEVTQPTAVSATPDPAGPNNDVTFTWDFTAQNAVEVHGAPSEVPQVVAASTDFFDLAQVPGAGTLVFTNTDEGIASFTPPNGFVFPFLDAVSSTFWVSTNGWVSLEAVTTPRPENLDFETTTTVLPPTLAPWWDNLQLGPQSAVLWHVDGTSFPRRLTIQWTRMLGNGITDSELTFQVQLYETGRFRYLYQRLVGGAFTQGRGETATIGFTGGLGKLPTSWGYNEAVASEGLELDWFMSGLAAGSFTSRVTRPGMFCPFFVTNMGQVVPAPLRTRVFLRNSVLVNEAMPVSHVIVPQGRWVELHNPGSEPVDVGGLELYVADAGVTRYVLPGPRVIEPGGYFVLGESADPAENGDAPVQEAWPADALTLGTNTLLNLRVPSALPDAGFVSQLHYGNLVDGGTTPAAGVSISQDRRAVRGNPPSPFVCATGTTMYGQTGSIGTPGAANDTCYPYRVEPITPDYEDISTSGQALFSGTASNAFDDKYTSVSMSPPFPYFGTSYGTLTVNTNGWVNVVPATSTGQTNKTGPTTAAPRGTIAPFWDDLDKKTSSLDGNVYTERKNGYRVIQWHHYGQWSNAGTFDDLNFEVKLFDTGVIEFHYGLMRNGGVLDRSDGHSATVWIEEPTGQTALPISINTPAPRQNTAWRFTPVP